MLAIVLLHLTILVSISKYIYIDWSDYGVDWDEVTSADDDNMVVVEEIERILTDELFKEFTAIELIEVTCQSNL